MVYDKHKGVYVPAGDAEKERPESVLNILLLFRISSKYSRLVRETNLWPLDLTLPVSWNLIMVRFLKI